MRLPFDDSGNAIQTFTQGTVQKMVVDPGSDNLLTTAVNAKTNVIRICSDTACHYKTGPAATVAAAVTDSYLPADTIEYIGIAPGDKIAVIGAVGSAAGGFMTVTEPAA